jgi:hypothetical protein
MRGESVSRTTSPAAVQLCSMSKRISGGAPGKLEVQYKTDGEPRCLWIDCSRDHRSPFGFCFNSHDIGCLH